MAGILRRKGFGVKRKALQDIVVGLQCGKLGRKMAGNELVCLALKGAKGEIYGECGIQFWRREAGDAEFGRAEVAIFDDSGCCGGVYSFDGGHDIDSDGTCGSADAVRASDGRRFARRDSPDQSAEVRGKDDGADTVAERERERALERRADAFVGHIAAIPAGPG